MSKRSPNELEEAPAVKDEAMQEDKKQKVNPHNVVYIQKHEPSRVVRVLPDLVKIDEGARVIVVGEYLYYV